MKDHLVSLVRVAPSPVQGRNLAREYLQARILGALQRAGAMIPLAFRGGTALRFLFASARYSENLDFSRNLILLNNALRQAGWEAEPLTEVDWRQAVQQRLQGVAWEPVADDVRPFLDSSADVGLLTEENLKRVLGL